MGILFLIIFAISAVLLVLVIMVQDEQGEGVGGIFGGGSSTAFGSRSGNILTRITAILAGVFLVSALILTYINRTPSETTLETKARLKQLQENSTEWKYSVDPKSETGTLENGTDGVTPTDTNNALKADETAKPGDTKPADTNQ
jgi:preprotein translocase subunit SecG